MLFSPLSCNHDSRPAGLYGPFSGDAGSLLSVCCAQDGPDIPTLFSSSRDGPRRGNDALLDDSGVLDPLSELFFELPYILRTRGRRVGRHAQITPTDCSIEDQVDGVTLT